ncbi:MAG TPA: hypothetical protein VNN62_09970 [Methylomirabilota bacterium]|nr:hypothetical protein [Methylomirabilota bacterium]
MERDELATHYRLTSDAAREDYDQQLRHLIELEAMLTSVWRQTLS